MSLPDGEQQEQVDMTSLKEEVEMLRQLQVAPRVNVSESAQHLMDYCLRNAHCDGLVTKISSSKNPFRERDTRCELL